MMPLIGECLDFEFYFFKKASLEQFYMFNYAAEGNHEQTITFNVLTISLKTLIQNLKRPFSYQ